MLWMKAIVVIGYSNAIVFVVLQLYVSHHMSNNGRNN